MAAEAQNATTTRSILPSRIRPIPWLMAADRACGCKWLPRYQTARDAAEYARWDARDSGGTIDVFDQRGRLYRVIKVKSGDSVDAGLVLPSI